MACRFSVQAEGEERRRTLVWLDALTLVATARVSAPDPAGAVYDSLRAAYPLGGGQYMLEVGSALQRARVADGALHLEPPEPLRNVRDVACALQRLLASTDWSLCRWTPGGWQELPLG